MAQLLDLVVPALGESITEAVISKWLVGVGEHVEADAPVVDLETDKITVQLPAPAAGALAVQRYAEGDTVRVGDVVGQIDSAASAGAPARQDRSEAKPAAASRPAPAQAAPDAARPAPAQAPEPARASGNGAGADGGRVAERDAAGRVLPPSRRRGRAETAAAAPASRASGTATQPAASKPAASKPAASKPAAAARPAPAARPQTGDREDVVPMSPLRKRIAERLVEAQRSSASLTTFNEVDMTAVMQLRGRHKDAFLDAHGVKLGFMSFFVKAAVAALKEFPGLNAEVRGDAIVYKRHYDLGIAVGTDRGLVVPVLRECDKLSFASIEGGIVELSTRAREGKLALEDLVGGTFTITNGGIYGSMMSTPLLNYPQTGILGMHNIVDRPMVVDGQIAVRPVMYIALTYDHRVVDGKEAVQFLVAVKQRVEAPDRLMFEV